MRIIIIDSLFSSYGGGQKIAYETYRILKENGVEVFYWGMEKKPYFDSDYEYSKFFTPYYGGKKDHIKNPIKCFYNYRAKQDLIKFLDIIKPDLIHIHSTWGLSPAIFSGCKNYPTILTMHVAGCCPTSTLMIKGKYLCKEQKCKNRNFLPCIVNKCSNNNLKSSIIQALLAFIYACNYKYIDKFITPSFALQKVMENANIGINSKNAKTIYNFLNNEELKTEPNYLNEGYFLYIGRLNLEKGVHYLLKAMKDLSRDIKLHIVGTGYEEERLKQYAKDNDLYNVKFLGFKSGKEIINEYQNCIATVLPSNWFEIFGMTNIESFINGKPVIASNIGGIPEIVEDNKTGLLFEPANAEELKECILQYWNNPNLVVEHGENAYQKAKTKYTIEQYYQELIKVYGEVINARK